MKNAPTMAAATATVMNNSYPNNKSSIAADDASDILVTSSYVDTVVTLRLRHVINNKLSAPEIVAAATTVERGTNNNANENIRTNHDSDNTIVDDNIPSTAECITSSWKKKKPSGQEKLSNNEENCSWSGNNNNNYDDDENDKTTNNNETLVVHSLWQAEIQDRVYDDDNNINTNDNNVSKSSNNNGVSLVDYAFVESLSSTSSLLFDGNPKERSNAVINNDGDDSYCYDKELRWKINN